MQYTVKDAIVTYACYIKQPSDYLTEIYFAIDNNAKNAIKETKYVIIPDDGEYFHKYVKHDIHEELVKNGFCVSILETQDSILFNISFKVSHEQIRQEKRYVLLDYIYNLITFKNFIY